MLAGKHGDLKWQKPIYKDKDLMAYAEKSLYFRRI